MQPPHDPNANSNAPYPPQNSLAEAPPGFQDAPQGQFSPQGQPAYPPQNPASYGQNTYPQNPYPQNPAIAPAPRKKSPLKKAAVVCGVGLLGLIGVGFLVGDDKGQSGSGSAPGASIAYTSPEFARYTGKWLGSDGTSMWIRGDGQGDFNSGSVKVSGGGVTLDEKARTLAITSFLNIGKTWQITEPSDGSQMTLGNIVFRRTDGGGVASSSTSSSTSSASEDTSSSTSEISTGGGFAAGEVPPRSEQKRLVQESLTIFDSALRDEDFSALYDHAAKAWQEQTNASELKAAFKPFLDQNVRLDKVLSVSEPRWTGEPEIDASNILRLSGYYPAGTRRLVFKVGYLNEGGAWKLAVLNVKTADA